MGNTIISISGGIPSSHYLPPPETGVSTAEAFCAILDGVIMRSETFNAAALPERAPLAGDTDSDAVAFGPEGPFAQADQVIIAPTPLLNPNLQTLQPQTAIGKSTSENALTQSQVTLAEAGLQGASVGLNQNLPVMLAPAKAEMGRQTSPTIGNSQDGAPAFAPEIVSQPTNAQPVRESYTESAAPPLHSVDQANGKGTPAMDHMHFATAHAVLPPANAQFGASLAKINSTIADFGSAAPDPAHAPIPHTGDPSGVQKNMRHTPDDPMQQPLLLQGSVQVQVAGRIVPQSSETARFGFEMRIAAAVETHDESDGSNFAGADMRSKALPAPRPNEPIGNATTTTAQVTAGDSGTDRLSLPETASQFPLVGGAGPVADGSLFNTMMVPQRLDGTVLQNTPTVALADLPQTIATAARADATQSVSLQVDPIELGTVAFNMDTGPAGLVVTIIAERPETLDLLRRNADQFLADLRQSGFQGASLHFGQSGGQAGNQAWGQSGQSGQDRGPNQRAPDTGNAVPTPLFQLQPPITRQTPNSGLDLRL